MERYNNKSGKSGISGYEIGDDYILVKFKTNKVYKYNHAVTGKQNVDKMKNLAISGRGLNSFISKKVRYKYVR